MTAIIIIPVELQPIAEQAVKSLDPLSEGESFIIDLRPASPVGSDPLKLPAATHVACTPEVSDLVMQQIRGMVNSPPFALLSQFAECEYNDTLTAFLALCQKLGLERIEPPRVEVVSPK